MHGLERPLGVLMLHICLVLVMVGGLSACASGAKPEAMAIGVTEQTLIDADSPLRGRIAVGSVGGGQETNALWTSEVSNADFAEALRRTLAVHTLLATGTGDYVLSAELREVKQPVFGFGMEVTSRIFYRLVEQKTSRPVFEREIAESYTAPFSSAFLGTTRLRLANEGSIRENLSQFINAMIEDAKINPALRRGGGDLILGLRILLPSRT